MAHGAGKRRKNRKKPKSQGKSAVARPEPAATPGAPSRSRSETPGFTPGGPDDEPAFVLVDPTPDPSPLFEDDREPAPPAAPVRRHRRRPPGDPARRRTLIRAALYAGMALLVALVVLWVLQSSDPNRVTPENPPPIVQP